MFLLTLGMECEVFSYIIKIIISIILVPVFLSFYFCKIRKNYLKRYNYDKAMVLMIPRSVFLNGTNFRHYQELLKKTNNIFYKNKFLIIFLKMSNSNANSNSNIINTLIDPKNMKNIPENVNNEIVEQLIRSDKEWNENAFAGYTNPNQFESNYNPNVEGGNQTQAQIGDQTNENLVLNYTSTNTLYSIAFQNSDFCRLAVGTLEKNLKNRIEIVEMKKEGLGLAKSEPHEFPSTKLMWSQSESNNNVLAASSDVVRLYKYSEEDQKLTLNLALNNKKSKYCAPLTSFDWNRRITHCL